VHAADVYDYAIIRVVPRVEREEFINVGVIVSCHATGFLDARIELDATRLRALDPGVDLDAVLRHLEVFPRICRGGPEAAPIGLLPPRSRFYWLTAKRSSLIQTSPVHVGRTRDLAATVEHLLQSMVRTTG
jgi:hypothetical protein